MTTDNPIGQLRDALDERDARLRRDLAAASGHIENARQCVADIRRQWRRERVLLALSLVGNAAAVVYAATH